MIAQLAKPLMTGFSKLSDEDTQELLLGLCSCVEIHQPALNVWSKICNEKSFQFDHLELPTLLRLSYESFILNLSGFFDIAHPTSHGGK